MVVAISSRGRGVMGLGTMAVVLVLDGGGGALQEEPPGDVAAVAWWPVRPAAMGCLPSESGLPGLMGRPVLLVAHVGSRSASQASHRYRSLTWSFYPGLVVPRVWSGARAPWSWVYRLWATTDHAKAGSCELHGWRPHVMALVKDRGIFKRDRYAVGRIGTVGPGYGDV